MHSRVTVSFLKSFVQFRANFIEGKVSYCDLLCVCACVYGIRYKVNVSEQWLKSSVPSTSWSRATHRLPLRSGPVGAAEKQRVTQDGRCQLGVCLRLVSHRGETFCTD